MCNFLDSSSAHCELRAGPTRYRTVVLTSWDRGMSDSVPFVHTFGRWWDFGVLTGLLKPRCMRLHTLSLSKHELFSEMLPEEFEDTLPGIRGGLLVVNLGTIVVEEGVIGARIDVHFDRLTKCLQLSLQLTH